jgi:hypothetical protein
MAGINGSVGLAGLLLAAFMASSATAGTSAHICPSEAVEAATSAPVIPAAEIVPLAKGKKSEDCPTSTDPTADDDVCVFKPGTDGEKAPAPAQKDGASPQVSARENDKSFVGQLLRTAVHVWSAVVTTLDVVTNDERL